MAEQLPIGHLTLVNEHRRLIAEGVSSSGVSDAQPSSLFSIQMQSVSGPSKKSSWDASNFNSMLSSGDSGLIISFNIILAMSIVMIQPYPITTWSFVACNSTTMRQPGTSLQCSMPKICPSMELYSLVNIPPKMAQQLDLIIN